MRYQKLLHRGSYKGVRSLIDIMLEIPIEFRGTPAIEVGSFYGESTVIFSLFFKPVYSVDIFCGSVTCGISGESVHEAFIRQTENRDIVSIVADSAEAARMIPDNVSMVYIDADHTYEGCKRDIETYWPKLAPGGFMCGHDYFSGNVVNDGKPNGVRDAVNDTLGLPRIVFQDSSWLIQKTPERIERASC